MLPDAHRPAHLGDPIRAILPARWRPTAMIVDMHAHILTEEMIRLMQGVSKTYAPVLSTTDTPYPSGLTTSSQGFALTFPSRNSRTTWPEGGHNVDLRLEDMARTGVDVQAISPFVGTFLYEIPAEVNVEFCKLYNEQFADLKKAHPGKFAPLATVPLQDGQAAADELERAVNQLGLHGVATSTSLADSNLDDERLEPFYAKLNELRVPWFIHPSFTPIASRAPKYYLTNFIGNPLETTIAVATLIFGGVMERYPNIRCWTPHAGGFVPYQFGRLNHGYQWRDEPRGAIAKPPGEYLDAFLFDIIAHSRPALDYLVQTFGAEQVYLGTDYPFDMGLADPIGTVEAIETTDEAGKAKISEGNARAALRI
jgi:aminocarboxymuconate-semialdehyde decarboxylase